MTNAKKTAAPVDDAPTLVPMGERRPYVLESATLENEIRRSANQARDEIAAIDLQLDVIERKRARDIAAINAAADAEVKGREDRKADLFRIVAIETTVFGERASDAEAPDEERKAATSDTLAAEIERQRTESAS